MGGWLVDIVVVVGGWMGGVVRVFGLSLELVR